jgi:hypothetical protein
MEKVVTQPAFEELRLVELYVPPGRLESTKGFHLNLNWGEKWYRSWDHL